MSTSQPTATLAAADQPQISSGDQPTNPCCCEATCLSCTGADAVYWTYILTISDSSAETVTLTWSADCTWIGNSNFHGTVTLTVSGTVEIWKITQTIAPVGPYLYSGIPSICHPEGPYGPQRVLAQGSPTP